MITSKEITIVEEVRTLKEANAAKHDFDVSKIIDAARQRQEMSNRKIIRQGEYISGGQPPASHQSDVE